jgi:ABC-type transport system involved in cytochrome c biogenesis permease subunit
MNALGIMHILLLLGSYVLYLLTTLRSFSGKVSYRTLCAANIVYAAGFVLGMLWSNDEWGFYLSTDPKIILSLLVPVPYLIENVFKTKKWILPAAGGVLIVLNYVLPELVSTLHTN